jgi:hypothetical protein
MKRNRVSLYTLGAEHNAERKMQVFKNWPLFDVQFQIGGDVLALQTSVAHLFDADVTSSKSVLQTDSIAICTDAVSGNGVSTGKCRRSKEAPAEACTLLVRPIDQPDRNRRPAMKILGETTQDLKTGKNAKAAVQPATVRNRVEMTAKDKGAFGIAPKCRP